MTVTTSGSASSDVTAAANSLAEKLTAMSGATFGVATGSGPSGILVGVYDDFDWPLVDAFDLDDPRRTEDYIIRSHPTGVYVAGASALGVRHAVWDLLHRLGYRQFFPGDAWEIVPSLPTLRLNLDVTESPDWHGRRFGIHFNLWSANSPRVAAWNERNRMAQGIVLNTAHAYAAIRDRNQAAFDAHPEYYTELDGVRQVSGGANVKFDISNADLRQLVIDDTLGLFAANSSLQSASLDPSDGSGWGNSAAEEALGSISDRVVYLANVVAEAVDLVYPSQKWIGIYAYNKHSPPPNIAVNLRVVVSVATRFLTGGHTPESLIAGWGAKGATLGMREYYSVNVWDRDLPGKAKVADPGRIRDTLASYYDGGARWMTSESGDGWGPGGLGYYLAARYLWSRSETANHDALVQDFLTKCFGPAIVPMTEFYALIDGANKPLVSPDLIGRMYRALQDALGLTADAAIRRRIYDLALYTRYVELFRAYELSESTGGARQAAFETLLRFAYQISVNTHMVHSNALWRDLETRDENVEIPPEAHYGIDEPDNPWKSSEVISDATIDGYITDGIANNPLLEFEPVQFSDDLVPATPLNLTSGNGSYNYIRGEGYYHAWIDTAPGQVAVNATGGKSQTTEGDVVFELYPRAEPELAFVDSDQIPPDKTTCPLTFDSEYDGLQTLRITDRGGGYDVNPQVSGTPLTFECGLDRTVNWTGRWTMYFYVPKGTTVIGGYTWGAGTTTEIGTLRDGDGNVVFTFLNMPEYWSVAVPPGQDGKVWRFDDCLRKRALMTVPPYVARKASELLLPREVVLADQEKS